MRTFWRAAGLLMAVSWAAGASEPPREGERAPAPAVPPPPAAPAPAATASPAEGRKPGPFAPTPLLREYARKAAAASEGAAPAASAAEGHTLILEGLIVKEKTVLACVRSGAVAHLVEAGASFKAGGATYTLKYKGDDLVEVRDQNGEPIEVMLVGRPSRPQPRVAEPP
jgi:hypothetical protein